MLLLYLSQLAEPLFSIQTQGFSLNISTIIFISNSILFSLAISIILRFPLILHRNPPIGDEEGHPPPMEDHCTLWSWITFSWVNDLLSIKSLEEKDLWSLSPSLRSRLLLRKFLQISCSAEENTTSKVKNKASLLYLLFRANSKDLIIDFGLTLFSSSLAYTGPFFLNKILRTISETQNQLEEVSSSSKQKAYLYATFAFIAALMKSQSDLQHLFYARRASARIRSELTATIYEKVLRKKDGRGSVREKR